MDFVHLHVHTHYSLLDGACRIEELRQAAVDNQMPALAVTDHGNLFGALKFYSEMKEAGVKPIIGYEAYVAPGDRRNHETTGMKDAGYHLTLLCMNLKGYHNLIRLASKAYLEGFYRKPRIDKELLSELNEGLIVLSGCASSEINELLLRGDEDGAAAVATWYRNLLGDRFYMELQDNGLAVQKQCMRGSVEIARRLGITMVATNDIHYMRPEDAKAHEALLCVNTGKTMSDATRMQFGSNEFYFKTADEMARRFAALPEALSNTAAVAERCEMKMKLGQRHHPAFRPPEGKSCAEYLRELCAKGLKERLDRPTKEAKARLEYELGVIEPMGYSAYFLIVWDFVNFARQRGIPTGLRGSGVGAMVSYVLRISDIDPLKYGLLFERFLDPQRREPPDLDVDICENGREEVLRYVKEKYGQDSTAQIMTLGTLAARNCVRNVGRALEIPLPETDRLAKLIPETLHIKLEEALDQEPELRQACETQERVRELFDIAIRLEGLARNVSTHAAGLVMADRDLTEYIPLCLSNDVVMSQFDMNDLEKVGMLKMDFLGLRTLTIDHLTAKLVEQREGSKFDLSALPFDDRATYELLGRGDTEGVFQLGSMGMRELLRKLKPRNMEDIIAVVAMYRPGPLGSGMVNDFVERRHGRRPIPPMDPRMAEILQDTCGIIVYQEQIMRIANVVAGMPLSDALSMLKAISKKKAEVIDRLRADFIRGAVQGGLTEEQAAAVYNLIREFAGYGFNRAHATAYAFEAYTEAYLKAHHPVEFAAAGMSCEMHSIDDIVAHMGDCRHLGIEVLRPDVNESKAHFTVTRDGKIRYGLGAIRGAGVKAMELIGAEVDSGGPFGSLADFCARVDLQAVNRKVIEALVKSGAMDGLPGNRAQKMAVLEEAMRVGQRLQRDRRRGQKNLFEGLAAEGRDDASMLPDVPEWPALDLLKHEKEALGFYMSGHPLLEHKELLEQLSSCPVEALGRQAPDSGQTLGGMVVALRRTTTKRGDAMARIVFEDLTGKVDAVVFPDTLQRFGRLLTPEAILFLRGTVDRNMDRPSFRVDEAVTLEEAPARLTGAVTLRVERLGLEEKLLEELYQVCARHRGTAGVVLDVVLQDRRHVLLRAGRALTVAADREFLDEVEGVLGKGRARLMPAAYGGNGGNGYGRRRNGANGYGRRPNGAG